MRRAAELVWLYPAKRRAGVAHVKKSLGENGEFLPFQEVKSHEFCLPITDTMAPQNFELFHALLGDIVDRGSEAILMIGGFDLSEASIKMNNGFSSLVCMLILSFPDVRSVFFNLKMVGPGTGLEGARRFLSNHFRLKNLTANPGSYFYDGMGLREILFQLNNAPASLPADEISDWISAHMKTAVFVLDDEDQFRSMMSLAAYSWGFRVFSPASWREVTTLVGASGLCGPNAHPLHKVDFSLEDIFLNFYDQGDVGLDNDEERVRLLPRLAHGRRRFVSTGEPSSHGRRAGGTAEQSPRAFITKPTRDYFPLWDEVWGQSPMPMSDDRFAHGEGTATPHGAHGRIIVMAEAMVRRARQLLSESPSLHDKLRVAVASADAYRLLDGRSPMLAAEALYLRHIAEVSVVAGEVGARSRLDIRPRLEAIERSLEAIADRVPDAGRKLFATNAQVKIVTALEAILFNASLFVDAAECHRQAIQLRQDLSLDAIRSSSEPRLSRWLRWLSVRYFGFALRSPTTFIVATSSWFLACVVLFVLALGDLSCSGLMEAFDHAVTSFITVNLPNIDERPHSVTAVSYLSSLLGLLHFGILISLIYSYWIDRR